MRSNTVKSLTLISLLIPILLAVPVSAGNISITFANMDIDPSQSILIYNSAGSFISENQTTDTISLDANDSYVFIIKPTTQSWFNDPFSAFDFIELKFPTLVSWLIWIAVILGIIILITALARRR